MDSPYSTVRRISGPQFFAHFFNFGIHVDFSGISIPNFPYLSLEPRRLEQSVVIDGIAKRVWPSVQGTPVEIPNRAGLKAIDIVPIGEIATFGMSQLGIIHNFVNHPEFRPGIDIDNVRIAFVGSRGVNRIFPADIVRIKQLLQVFNFFLEAGQTSLAASCHCSIIINHIIVIPDHIRHLSSRRHEFRIFVKIRVHLDQEILVI